MNEDEAVFDILVREATVYDWGWTHLNHTLYKDASGRLVFFPKDGGVLIINSDGTWDGDIAPFCD